MTMLSFALATVPSLADPDGSHPFVAAVRWVEGVALGTIATSLALIAVASVGFLMLGGRLPVRRGVAIAAGCFILFGAPVIADGLLSALANEGTEAAAAPAPPPPAPVLAVPKPRPTPAYDPYAGAAVPPR